MKKVGISVFISLILSGWANADGVEQTICFAKDRDTIKFNVLSKRNPDLRSMDICGLPPGVTIGSLGDSVAMCGGKCEGRTLSDMNKDGWRLVHVVESLGDSYGIVLEKIK